MDKDINYGITYNSKKLETLSLSNDREMVKYAKKNT